MSPSADDVTTPVRNASSEHLEETIICRDQFLAYLAVLQLKKHLYGERKETKIESVGQVRLLPDQTRVPYQR